MAEEWYADKVTEGLAYRTTERHRQAWDAYILPALSELHLREATTDRLDTFVRAIGKNIGDPTANIVEEILKGIMGMDARYDAVPSNPARDVHVHKVETAVIQALTLDEFRATCHCAEAKLDPRTASERLSETGDARRMGSRNHSGVLLDIIDALIATGVRPGEVLAIRANRVDLGAAIPSFQIDSTIIRIKGSGAHQPGEHQSQRHSPAGPAAVCSRPIRPRPAETPAKRMGRRLHFGHRHPNGLPQPWTRLDQDLHRI
ncbi:hypothetical protein [Arthrobacter sp. N199823]|uniref:hypothetical protein n=1 Tax=Arthrobacter sp. N199823 TaxID=2058895 RepID=UPI000CE4C788|nr:hypothetical protein [Arthrobacter sp. N199823]